MWLYFEIGSLKRPWRLNEVWEWVLKGRMRPQECTCRGKTMWGTARSCPTVASTRQSGLRRNQPWWHLDLGWTYKFQELWDRKFLLMKPPSLGYFVIASIIKLRQYLISDCHLQEIPFCYLKIKNPNEYLCSLYPSSILPRPLSWTCHYILWQTHRWRLDTKVNESVLVKIDMESQKWMKCSFPLQE